MKTKEKSIFTLGIILLLSSIFLKLSILIYVMKNGAQNIVLRGSLNTFSICLGGVFAIISIIFAIKFLIFYIKSKKTLYNKPLMIIGNIWNLLGGVFMIVGMIPIITLGISGATSTIYTNADIWTELDFVIGNAVIILNLIELKRQSTKS